MQARSVFVSRQVYLLLKISLHTDIKTENAIFIKDYNAGLLETLFFDNLMHFSEHTFS